MGEMRSKNNWALKMVLATVFLFFTWWLCQGFSSVGKETFVQVLVPSVFCGLICTYLTYLGLHWIYILLAKLFG